MANQVLIIGGGVAGMAVALELAEAGIEVYIADKAQRIGGRAFSFTCKAVDQCKQCGACLAWQLKAKVEERSNIKLILQSEITRVEGQAGNFQVDIRYCNVAYGKDVGVETMLHVNAVVIAVGSTVFDAALLAEFGYGVHKNVITTLDLDMMLREVGSVAQAYGPKLQRIGFVQCVGSRDLRTGHSYCSRVCCKHSLLLAELVRQELPDSQIDVFYLDMQTFGKDFGKLWHLTRAQERIRFVRGIPSKIFRYPNDFLTVRNTNDDGIGVSEVAYDLVILAPAIIPNADTALLASVNGLSLSPDGFLVEPEQKGLFAAGTCCGPMDIPESIAHAQAVAGKLLSYLRKIEEL